MLEDEKRQIEILADHFLEAFDHGTYPGDRTFKMDSISLDQAYLVQDRVAEMRVARGENVVGYKVGCTSNAIRQQLGLSEPICGRLFEPFIFANKSDMYWDAYKNCAIEPEMVFFIGKDLKGENLSDEVLLAGISEVRAGIEIHQRKFWLSPNTSQELICSGGILLGLAIGDEKTTPDKLTFKDESFEVRIDGEKVASGLARDIMDNSPIDSLRWLVGYLTRKGTCLKAGSYVIPGSPVQLIDITKEMVLTVDIQNVGSVSTNFLNKKTIEE
jgi:2-keto-4-pentenoate hydratase